MTNQPVSWRETRSIPDLTDGEIHVWRIRLRECAGDRQWPANLLSADETERATRYRFEEDRLCYAVAHAALRVLLAGYTGRTATAIRYSEGEHGKPSLAPEPGSRAVTFNMSHSGDLVLLAFTRTAEIGVDVERFKPDFPVTEIADQFLALVEGAALRNVAPDRQIECFFRIWTRKEAYLKANGDGLYEPLDRFWVPAVPDLLSAPAAVEPVRGDAVWWLQDLDPGDGYAGALVTAHRPLAVCLLDWLPATRSC